MRRYRDVLETYQATIVLSAINVIAYLVVMIKGGGVDTLIQYGALFGPSIYFKAEYWRFFTAIFLHANMIHLIANVMALWFIGQLLEPILGRMNFVILYILSGLMGSVVSLTFNGLISVSVGASGAIYGLFASIFVLSWIFPYHRGLRLISQSLKGVFLVNVAISFMPGIDLWGHLGGVIGGTCVALTIGSSRFDRKWQWVFAGSYLAVLLLFFVYSMTKF